MQHSIVIAILIVIVITNYITNNFAMALWEPYVNFLKSGTVMFKGIFPNVVVYIILCWWHKWYIIFHNKLWRASLVKQFLLCVIDIMTFINFQHFEYIEGMVVQNV